MNKIVTKSSLGQTMLRWRGEKNKAQTNPKHFLKRESHSLYCLCVILYTCERFSSVRNSGRKSLNLGRKNPGTSTSCDNCKAAWQKRTWGLGIWTKLNMSHQPVPVAKATNSPGLHEGKCQQQAEGGDLSLHSPGEATSSRNAEPCSAGMGWRAPAVHTRDCELRGPGSVPWDCKSSSQNRHKRGHILQV